MKIKNEFEIPEGDRSFAERVNEWHKFEEESQNMENSEEYREGCRLEAKEYYKNNILPTVIEKCRENTANIASEDRFTNPDYMILTVGTSFEPLVLSISTIQPQKEILFLCTTETEAFMKQVTDFLELRNYSYERINATSTVGINREIRKYYEKWQRENPSGKIVADFTGGTKAMSVGCALAGVLLDTQLIYVEPARRKDGKIIPGSECITLIKNPYEISGAIEYEKAMKLFEACDYKSASEILNKVLINLRGDEAEKYKLVKSLCDVYAFWNEMDFEKSLTAVSGLVNDIKVLDKNESAVTFLQGNLETLSAHQEVLESLKKIHNALTVANEREDQRTNNETFNILHQRDRGKDIGNLILFFYLKAQRSAKRGDYNTAVLLMYRITELISRRRLAVGHNINVSAFADDDTAAKAQGKLKSLQVTKKIENQLNQLEQYAVLSALEDKIFEIVGDDNTNDSARLHELLTNNNKRNNGIYAHGFKNMGYGDYGSAKDVTTKWIKRFCRVEDIDFEATLKAHTFLTMKDLD